jgi:hypothetical protein
MRDWKKLAWLLVLVAILVAVNVFRSSRPGTAGLTGREIERAGSSGSLSAGRIPDAWLQLERLEPSDRVGAADVTRNIFEYARVKASPRPVRRQVEASPAPPPPPPEPRPPLRFFGLAEGGAGGGAQRALLTDGEEIYVTTPGDVVLGRYRLVRIQSTNVEVEDLSRNRRWVLPLEQQ